MTRTLTLRDALSRAVAEFSFLKDVPQEVSDPVYSRLLDTGQFEESPPAATYWVQAVAGRALVSVDGKLVAIGSEPKRVTRRVFSKLEEMIARGQVRRLFLAALLEPGERPRILVTRDMGAGDVLIATDLVHNVKLQWPGASVDFATHERHRCLLEENPDIDAIHTIGTVDPFDYDYDVFLPRRSEVWPDCSYKVRSDMYFEEISLSAIEHKTKLVLRSEEIDEIRETWSLVPSRPWIALQPCGTGFHRSLSPVVRESFAQLATRAGCGVAVFGTNPQEFPWEFPGVVNTCGKLKDVRQAAALIAACDLLLAPDSGGYHMAAALDPPIPSLVVFTTIDPALRVRDYPRCRAVWGGPSNLTCRPCWDRISCSGRFPCVNQTDPAWLWQQAEEMLRAHPVHRL